MKFYTLKRNGVTYTVKILKVLDLNPDQVLVESVIGPMFYGWVSITELKPL